MTGSPVGGAIVLAMISAFIAWLIGEDRGRRIGRAEALEDARRVAFDTAVELQAKGSRPMLLRALGADAVTDRIAMMATGER